MMMMMIMIIKTFTMTPFNDNVDGNDANVADNNPPVLHRPQKKSQFLEQIHDWKHLYLCISCTFRNSAIIPAIPSIQNAPPGDGLLDALATGWQSDSSFHPL